MQVRTQNNERVKTIIVAACVAFAVLLVISLIISIVSLSSATRRRNGLEQQLKELNTQIEQGKFDREYYQSDEYIEMIAREYLNMKGKDEITFVGK